MTKLSTVEAVIPDHVPPHLVKPWDYESAPGFQLDPHLANAALFQGPDIFYSPITISSAEPGTWMVTRGDLVREIFQDPETFSSQQATGFSKLFGEEWNLVPIENDGRSHQLYRLLMNPLFSPKKIAVLEDGIRQAAAEMIDACLKKDECDFQTEFGQPFPVSVFLRLMGLPLDMMDSFSKWEAALLHGKTKENRGTGARAIKDYLLSVIDDRRKRPTDDLVSFAVTSTIEGRLLSEDEVLGMCFILFAGGLDTVSATLSFAFKYLAENPEQQGLLRRDPDLVSNAMEEMLRAFAVVTAGRLITKDMNFHGIEMRKGDRIRCPMPISGRDDREYNNPNVIDFRRENIRHNTFGAGPHRCIGSHLARREIKIALDEWLARAPEFRIPEGKRPVAHADGIWGFSSLPLTW